MLARGNNISNRLVASIKVGIKKEAAKLALVKFKKKDELMRKRLFIFQVKSNMVKRWPINYLRPKQGSFLIHTSIRYWRRKTRRNANFNSSQRREERNLASRQREPKLIHHALQSLMPDRQVLEVAMELQEDVVDTLEEVA